MIVREVFSRYYTKTITTGAAGEVTLFPASEGIYPLCDSNSALYQRNFLILAADVVLETVVLSADEINGPIRCASIVTSKPTWSGVLAITPGPGNASVSTRDELLYHSHVVSDYRLNAVSGVVSGAVATQSNRTLLQPFAKLTSSEQLYLYTAIDSGRINALSDVVIQHVVRVGITAEVL